MEEETAQAAQAAQTAEALQAQEAAQAAAFAEITDEGKPPGGRDIDFLLDIPLVVSVEIGRTKMLIKDLLQLGQGSVVEFDKLVGEPMEVLVNEKLIARGEVVVVNEKFGVRLTDISSPSERLKHLK
jgi:flagellar motor switch protein FliN/FliY